jgi:hypothetical protein
VGGWRVSPVGRRKVWKDPRDRRQVPRTGAAIDTGGVCIDWKEALYLGTRGGAIALGLGGGVFQIGAPFGCSAEFGTSIFVHSVGSYADFSPITFSFAFSIPA